MRVDLAEMLLTDFDLTRNDWLESGAVGVGNIRLVSLSPGFPGKIRRQKISNK